MSDEYAFDGSTYNAELDQERLSRQYDRVFALMSDGEWRTLAQIRGVTGDPEAAISARLRDMRKPRFGSHTVNSRRLGNPKDGVWEYRLAISEPEAEKAESNMSRFSIRKLQITNFRAVLGTVTINLNDNPGLYFIAGQNHVEPRLGANGCGKSTLFPEAILWCLYGVTSRDARPGSDVENWTVDAIDPTGVVCTFHLNGAEHSIERWRNPSALKLDGERVEQRVIDEMLPLNSAALRRSLLIDQFSNLFLSLRPEEKSQIFSDTLNLWVWLESSDYAGDMAKEAEQEYAAADRRIAGYEASLSERTAQLVEAERLVAAFEADRGARLRQLRDDRTRQAASVAGAEQLLNTARQKLSDTGGGDQKLLVNDKRREEQRLLHACGNAEARRHESGIQRLRLLEALQAYGSEAVNCPECGQAVTQEHIVKKRQELEQRIAEHDRKFDELLAATQALPGELLTVQGEIAKLDQELQSYDGAQAEVSVYAERSIAELRALHKLDDQIKEVTEQINTHIEQVAQYTNRIAELTESLETERANLTDLQHEAELYKFWQRGYREIRLEQIDATLTELELAANTHAQALGLTGWEIRFATERETAKGSIAHTFNVALYPPGQTEPISWQSYSGGESQRWQLATTFALAEVLLARSGIDSDFECFDEPTAHLSPEGIDDLLACLKNRATEYSRRVYIIDHHALDRGAFDGIYLVSRTPQGVSVSRDGLSVA